MTSKIIQQGAEAILKKIDNKLLKQRIKKGYRSSQLDEKLRRQRTKREFSLLQKASKIIPVPKIIKGDENKKEIFMDYIKGKKLSDYLDYLKNSIQICKKIGENIAKLHDSNIIHGDLTTSNMIYSEKEKKLYFIDFGLGYISSKIEDKAVDMHLIKEALEAKHFNNSNRFFKAVLDGYKISKYQKETLKRLERVEKRGRYKQSY